MKKILAITGIRSEYDIAYPVLERLRRSGDFQVCVAVSGAHLSDLHDYSAARIEADGFEIVDRIDTLLMTNRTVQRAKGVGLLVAGLTQTVERVAPDFLFVVGDREESIATCIVGNYMNVLTAHLGGGDPVYGNADDPIRFACSKLAHIHFATARHYAENLRRLGEEEFRICFSGNPANANIAETPYLSLPEISREIGFDIADGQYVVLLQHPLSSEHEDAYQQMMLVLTAVSAFARTNGLKVVGIRPNSDPGSYDILRAIDEFEDGETIRFFHTLPRKLFVNLMRNALCLAGNSSMGILEAPMYRLPVVNIGNRQKGRLNAGNVIFTSYDQADITMALTRSCYDEGHREGIRALVNPYGDGDAPDRVLDFLKQVDLSQRQWYVKRKLCNDE